MKGESHCVYNLELSAHKIQNNENFPRNLKKHQLDTRNQETFKVQVANTDRLKKSPKILMLHIHTTLVNSELVCMLVVLITVYLVHTGNKPLSLSCLTTYMRT